MHVVGFIKEKFKPVKPRVLTLRKPTFCPHSVFMCLNNLIQGRPVSAPTWAITWLQ